MGPRRHHKNCKQPLQRQLSRSKIKVWSAVAFNTVLSMFFWTPQFWCTPRLYLPCFLPTGDIWWKFLKPQYVPSVPSSKLFGQNLATEREGFRFILAIGIDRSEISAPNILILGTEYGIPFTVYRQVFRLHLLYTVQCLFICFTLGGGGLGRYRHWTVHE